MSADATLDSNVIEPNNSVQPHNLSIASELWREITEAWNDFRNYCDTVKIGIRDWTVKTAKTIWNGIPWVWREMVKPGFVTGINVFGYLVDKFLLGAPGIRPGLHDGVLSSDIPDRWRNYVKDNSGWDIYEKSHPIVNNFFGIVLGGGIGVLNFINHSITSIYHNIRNFWHVLGVNGVFGNKTEKEDKRNLAVKSIFGLLTLPIVAPAVLTTNILDGLLAFAKNMSLSFAFNLASSANFMGKDGCYQDRYQFDDPEFHDNRKTYTKIIYGILSAPLVIPFAIVSNTVDFVLSSPANLVQSWFTNCVRTANLLGTYGVFGERFKMTDDRKLATQILFGIISAPLVLPLSILSNALDVTFTLMKHIGISFKNNLRSTFNLLGKDGFFGERYKIDDARFGDNRSRAAKIIYGIISAPLVAPFALLGNLIDVALSFPKNMKLSFWNNLRSSLGIFSTDDVYNENYKLDDPRYKDERNTSTKAIFGILTAPLVAALSVTANTFDLVLSLPQNIAKFLKNSWMSASNNFRSSANLLGKDGVFGERYKLNDKRFNDQRSMVSKVIFGLITAPLVLPFAALTNALDFVLSTPKNLGRSFWNNLRSSANFLGKNGMFGEGYHFDDAIFADNRARSTKIIFGILSIPLVAPFAAISNVVDVILSVKKNLAISFWNNLRSASHVLGKYGVFGSGYKFDDAAFADNRDTSTKIIYGILSAPLVAPFVALTNTVDAVCSVMKNTAQSFWNNLRSSFNLLGKCGVFGNGYQFNDKRFGDNRDLPARVAYGIISFPLVAPLALITNALDVSFSFLKNFGISLWNNIRSSFNLLGDDGFFGTAKFSLDDAKFNDKRCNTAKVVFGILSLPIVAPIALALNAFDLIISAPVNMAKSLWNNLRSSFNLLGENGVFGKRRPLDDNRGYAAKIIYGILTMPIVAPLAVITNTIDCVASFAKNLALSFWRNIQPTYTFFGKYGVMGPAKKYDDGRGMFAKVVFGALTFPAVATAAVITNAIDGVCAFFKNYKDTIKQPLLIGASVTVGIVSPIPFFMIRKLVVGLYNTFIMPVKDKVDHKPFNGYRLVKGIANVLTLGMFSAVKKVFEACTGYSSRFGFPKVIPGDTYNETNNIFRTAIDLAAHGKFPGVNDGKKSFRPFIRVVYGFQHKVEEILKTLHDAYLAYAADLKLKGEVVVANPRLNMHSFFSSDAHKSAVSSIKLREGEDKLLQAAEEYLQRPALA